MKPNRQVPWWEQDGEGWRNARRRFQGSNTVVSTSPNRVPLRHWLESLRTRRLQLLASQAPQLG